jgi:dolichyl-phosphate beta-glucosyltransferase
VTALVNLSIVIPAFNEGERLARTLEAITSWTKAFGMASEVIVVDDGSTDDTVSIAQRFGNDVRILSYSPNRGKGHAVRHGVLHSTGETILFTDADMSTPIDEWHKLARALETHDIAIGSRALNASQIEARQPWYREAMGKTFNRIVRLFAVRGISDTQCGFKLFRGSVAREIFMDLKTWRFAFDVEVLFLAQRRGYRIAEVPVVWRNDERTSVHAVLDSSRMLRDVIRLRLRYLGK